MKLTAEEIQVESEVAEAWDRLTPEVSDRRMMVKDLRRKGLSNTAIASITGVSPATISTDISWLKKIHAAYVNTFSVDEHIGETVALLKEVEDKSMDLAEEATKIERIVDYVNEKGEFAKRMETVTDHNAVAKHLQNAMTARKQQSDYMQSVGILKYVPRKIEMSVNVGEMDDNQLRTLVVNTNDRIAKLRSEIARIAEDGCVKEQDSGWTHRLIGDRDPGV